ncbi:MAG TPA: MarR family transcriptional regulator [Chloroflexi bacterium]|jgi:DNA-binding MarR family transcriptional regulator|nr:MarR family transcriptional regulator [Chloroflexota bacterium]
MAREEAVCGQHHDESIDRLLAEVCHLHRSRAHQLLEALGLYRGQPPVLFALWEQEGLTHTELAERLHNTPSTISKMLRRMERAGFLVRRVDAEDQRVSRVYLTDKGRAIQSDVMDVFRRTEAETFAGLAAEERAQLRGFLQQLRANLRRATQG